jgi:hypothetical protein
MACGFRHVLITGRARFAAWGGLVGFAWALGLVTAAGTALVATWWASVRLARGTRGFRFWIGVRRKAFHWQFGYLAFDELLNVF